MDYSITVGTAILLVVQGLMAVVLFCGVPWAYATHGRLSRIEAMLRSMGKEREKLAHELDQAREQGHQAHVEIFDRLRNVERAFDRCPYCTGGEPAR